MHNSAPLLPENDFARYLEENLKNPGFATRFTEAGEAWDIALLLSALQEASGHSQIQPT